MDASIFNPWNWGWFQTAVSTITGKPKPEPTQGEETQRQDVYQYGLMTGYGYAGLPYSGVGYSQAPGPMLQTYRMMERTWPTLALAYSIARAPVLAAPYTVEADDDSPDEWKELIEKTFIGKRLLTDLLKGMFRAKTLRFAPFEVIWGVVDRSQVPIRFKNLVQEATQILVDEQGELAGLRQNVELVGAKYFLYINEPDKFPVQGFSQLEYVRETAWWPWMEANQRGGMLDKKAAGIVFDVTCPSADQKIFPDNKGNANEWTGIQVGLWLANQLQQGISVATPNQVHKISGSLTPEALKILSGLSSFGINYHDLGNVGPSQTALQAKMQYYDSLGFRGYFLPERAGLEGKHGTKAESGEHAEFVTQDAEMTRQDMVNWINQGPVNNTLLFNFGPQAVGKVRLVPAPLRDEKLEVYKDTLNGLLANGMAPQIAKMIDIGSIFDRVGVPAKDGVDLNSDEIWTPVAPPAPVGQDKPLNGDKQSANGDGEDDDTKSTLKRFSMYLGHDD